MTTPDYLRSISRSLASIEVIQSRMSLEDYLDDLGTLQRQATVDEWETYLIEEQDDREDMP